MPPPATALDEGDGPLRTALLLLPLPLLPVFGWPDHQCCTQIDSRTTCTAEASIMRALRQSMNEVDPKGSSELFGWQLSNDARHCNWARVTCNQEGRIVALTLGPADPPMRDGAPIRQDVTPSPGTPNSATPSGTASPWNASSGSSGSQSGAPRGPFVPELAGLQQLEQLDMMQLFRHTFARTLAGIPPEWGLPGAFPTLKRCVRQELVLAEAPAIRLPASSLLLLGPHTLCKPPPCP